MNSFSKNFVAFIICDPNGIEETWLPQTYNKNDSYLDNLDSDSQGLEIRIKFVPAVDFQAMGSVAILQHYVSHTWNALTPSY